MKTLNNSASLQEITMACTVDWLAVAHDSYYVLREHVRNMYADWRMPEHKDTLHLSDIHTIFCGLRLRLICHRDAQPVWSA